MTFEDILRLIPIIAKELESDKTHYQIAADLHAKAQKEPSAFDVKPIKERKKREARKPATPAADLLNGHSTETAQ